jgi:hypothetical protein
VRILISNDDGFDAQGIKTFDFSTLYTTLPHDKLKTRLKETIHKAFNHRNEQVDDPAMYLSLKVFIMLIVCNCQMKSIINYMLT